MVRAAAMFLVVLINFILQSTVWRYAEAFGVIPDTALIIVVSYAILRGDVAGCLLGFFAGILPDVFYGGWVGLTALTLAMTGYLCGKPFKHFTQGNLLPPLLLVSVSVFAHEILYYSATLLLAGRRELELYFSRIILPEAVYTIAVTIPVFYIVFWVHKGILRLEKRMAGRPDNFRQLKGRKR
ncbi:MAG: rod shape-determining protein MreD [Clostridiales bacterium]|jgi:rod shape-determining protein MreD|nr:rod shape-determining protein MreD [Clostridiales bacterium]